MWQSAVGKMRYRSIKLEDGVLKAYEAYSPPLRPFKHPGLPTEFAKVTDEKTAIKFELRYAPLGYDLLVDNPEERKHGDPLDWVLTHAKFVRLALELLDDIDRDDGTDAMRQLDRLKIRRVASGGDTARRLFNEIAYPRGAYIARMDIPMARTRAEALWYARPLIVDLVNRNTKNVHEEMVVHHKGRMGSVLFYNSLIEAIWSMVGDLALKVQAGDDNGYFKRCRYCGTPFLATDKRQEFCPPPEGDFVERPQSLCGLKYRQRKTRKGA